MKKCVGWIALDIDGTITHDKYSVPKEVIDFLRERVQEGWRIAMATGRSYSFASLALSKFDFPYLFLPQNGSVCLEMPSKRCLFKSYLPKSILPRIEQAFEGIAGDMTVYTGYEKGDGVYFRPTRFDSEQMRYLHALWKREKESPLPVHSLDEIEQESFPLVKCFGRAAEMLALAERLRKEGIGNVAYMRDPFEPDYYILLVTDPHASKGQSLQKAMEELGECGLLIAAGDDENDIGMLSLADTSIAMPHAPEHVRKIADLIAPPTSELGVLHALQLAMKRHGK
jgi:Cof subfamily protein (haloacid dehalogenase superfamily)